MINFKLFKYGLVCCTIYATMLIPTVAGQEQIDETQVIATDLEQEQETDTDQADTGEPQAVERAGISRLAKRQRELLAAADMGPQLVTINADQEIHGYWQEDLSGKPRGAVLLLHDQSQNPMWPQTLQNFHEHLPPQGWATLSIELTALPMRKPPPRMLGAAPRGAAQGDGGENPDQNSAEALDEKTAEGSDEKTAEGSEKSPAEDPQGSADETQIVHQDEEAKALQQGAPTAAAQEPKEDDFEQRLIETLQNNQARIKAAIEHLNTQGQYNVVILGLGFGGYQALLFSSKSNLAAPDAAGITTGGVAQNKAIIERAIRAVVIVDTLNNYPQTQDSTLSFIDQPELPTMDIVKGPDSRLKEAAHERKMRGNKEGYQLYYLKALTPANGIAYQRRETELTRAVRGFLMRHASGKQL